MGSNVRRFLFALLLVLILLPCFAGEPKTKDIPPKKGDITKNIHVVFDRSFSMTVDNFKQGYKEVEALTMQGTDEFNLAITAFAANSIRMRVKDPDCKLKPNWMSMPSAIHARDMLKWIGEVQLIDSDTLLTGAIRGILKENKENVTIIVISDCIISDGVAVLDYIKSETAKKNVHNVKVGFVNVDKTTHIKFYERIKKDGHWYISVYEEDE